LQLLLYMLSISHTLVVVMSPELDFKVLQTLLVAEALYRKNIHSPSTECKAFPNIGMLLSINDQQLLYAVALTTYSLGSRCVACAAVFVINRIASAVFANTSRMLQFEQDLLARIPAHSNLLVDSADIVPDGLEHTLRAPPTDGRKRINWFLLPQFVSTTEQPDEAAIMALVCRPMRSIACIAPVADGCAHGVVLDAQQFHPKFSVLVTKLQRQLLQLEAPTKSGASSSEKEWFRNAKKQWEDISKSPVLIDESKRLHRINSNSNSSSSSR
jgi:hypothetical protein